MITVPKYQLELLLKKVNLYERFINQGKQIFEKLNIDFSKKMSVLTLMPILTKVLSGENNDLQNDFKTITAFYGEYLDLNKPQNTQKND
jgi:hypothetical protein